MYVFLFLAVWIYTERDEPQTTVSVAGETLEAFNN